MTHPSQPKVVGPLNGGPNYDAANEAAAAFLEILDSKGIEVEMTALSILANSVAIIMEGLGSDIKHAQRVGIGAAMVMELRQRGKPNAHD